MSRRRFPAAELSVFIDSWEIECCAPPPVVGGTTAWRLNFQQVASPDPESDQRIPGWVTDKLWQVETWPANTPPHAVYRNGVAAYCYELDGPDVAALPLGRHVLRGALFGTRHPGTDYDVFPTVSATVARIQVVSREVRYQDQRATAVPDSTRLVDVRQSPKWFARRAPGPVITVPTDASGGFRRRIHPDGLVHRADIGILLTIRDTEAEIVDRPVR